MEELNNVHSCNVSEKREPVYGEAEVADDPLKFESSDINYEEIFERAEHFTICNMNLTDDADDDPLKFEGSDINYEEIFERTEHFTICNMNILLDTSW